jgi:hypothetical protein
LLKNLGFKRTLKVIVDYPAMFLMPGFAFWTFAGIQLIEPCHICDRTTRIAVSFKMTLGQFFFVVTKIRNVFSCHLFF